MVGEAYEVAGSLIRYFTPADPADAARQALLTYLSALDAGRFGEAARFYGGEYEILIGYNPEIDPSSHAALFEAACTVNGFLCQLELKSILQETRVSDTEFRFTIEFQNQDGTLYEHPCVETGAAECWLQTQFDLTVISLDGQFRVLELPIYVS